MSLQFYGKSYENNYEEFLTYYPAFYRGIYEMREILKAQGKFADGLESCINQIYLNNFIDYADVGTIGRLEGFLNLRHNKTKDLDARRRSIKAHFMGYGISSASELAAIVKSYTNADVDIRFEECDEDGNHMLFIEFQRGDGKSVYLKEILAMLNERIPAHIKCGSRIEYRQGADIYAAGGLLMAKEIKIRQVDTGWD